MDTKQTPQTNQTQLTVDEAYSQAVEHFNAERYQKADKLCTAIMHAAPNHIDAINLLGVIAQKVNRHDLAIEQFQKAINIDNSRALLYYNLGGSLNHLGQSAEAIQALQTSLEKDPENSQVIGYLNGILNAEANSVAEEALQQGVSCHQSGRLDEAVVNLKKAISIKPNYADAYSNLGVTLKKQGKLDEAVTCYKKAISIKHDHAVAHLNLGLTLYDKGLVEETIHCYERALDYYPDFIDAQQALNKVRQLYKNKAIIYNVLGMHLFEKDCYLDAIECYKLSLEANSQDEKVKDNLAAALRAIHENESTHITRTHELLPSAPNNLKVIWISTVARTGSTWLHNVTREICKLSQKDVFPEEGYLNEEESLQMGNEAVKIKGENHRVLVLKVHSIISPALPNQKIITSIRDPRDVLVSFRRFMHSSFSRALHTGDTIGLFSDIYSKYPPEIVHSVDYRSIENSPIEIITNLASFINVKISEEDAQNIANKFSRSNVNNLINSLHEKSQKNLNVDANYDSENYSLVVMSDNKNRLVDKQTAFQTGHISPDQKRNWRTELTDYEKKIATDKYFDWLQAHKYPLE